MLALRFAAMAGLRETALSCLLLVPVYPALRAVRRAFPD
jgi:hypothetical protein